MKRFLYIVRHAKAVDDFFNDFGRELTTSGVLDASKMGKFLADKGVEPHLIVSSSAPRALKTAQLMAEQLNYPQGSIQATRDLYDKGPNAYLAAVNTAPEACESLLIFGHNPDVTYFAEYLTNSRIDVMSKGSVVTIELENLTWAGVSANTGRFISYDAPKQLKDSL